MLRRKPYPYDMMIDGVGVMLGRSDQGAPLVAQRPADRDQVAPTDYGYSADSPLWGRWQPWGNLGRGMGFARQERWEDGGYGYAINADLSLGTPWLKGPYIDSCVPSTCDSTNGISHFFEIGGVLYALNGRYCLRRDSDYSWTVARDFGAGNIAQDVVVFFSNAVGSANLAYIAMGDSTYMYKFDGTTFTQHASLYARAFAVVGREFYRAHSTNMMAKCDTNADPWIAANWTAANAFTVGDKSSPINRMAVTATGTLLIFKTDGVYTLDSLGLDQNLFPHLRFAVDADNGKAIGAWLNDLYVCYRQGTFRIRADFTIEEIGPEKLTANNSEVKGGITALQGHDTFNLYAGIYNPDNGSSYLMKFGSWIRGEDGVATRIDAWHGSISPEFANKKITALYRCSIGETPGHTRLYIGFSDGSISWFTLPCTPNPAACDKYRFSMADGEVYLPTWHGLFGSDMKTMTAIAVTGENISGSNYAQVEYKADYASAYKALPFNFYLNRQTIELPSNTVATNLDLKVILKSSDTSSCPRVTGMGLQHQVQTALRLVYEFNVMAADGLVRRDGGPIRIGARQIRDLVRTKAENAGTVTVVLPDEEIKEMMFADYSEGIAWDERLRQWRSALMVKAVEIKEISTQGTYASLENFTYGGLEAFNYGQMENL